MNVVMQIQKAVYDLLKGDSVLDGLVEDIYDFVPVGASYPYVTIGDATVKNNSGPGVVGFEVDLDVNVYSQVSGRKETLGILDRIFELVSGQNLAVSGYDFGSANFMAMDSQRLNNGDIEGKISFKVLLRESE